MRSTSLVVLAVVALGVPVLNAACKKKSFMTADACNAIIDTAGTALAAADRSARARATCNVDADCVESKTASCLGVGCGGHGVPKSEAASFAAAVGSIEGDACKRWRDGDCMAVAPRPMASCAPRELRCRNHRCRMSIPIALDAEECEELYGAAQDAVRETLAKADTLCTRDTDCVQAAQRPSCFTGCAGYPVARRGELALGDAVARIDKEMCEPWVRGGCPATTPKPVPSCAPVVASCKEGHCTNQISLPRGPL